MTDDANITLDMITVQEGLYIKYHAQLQPPKALKSTHHERLVSKGYAIYCEEKDDGIVMKMPINVQKAAGHSPLTCSNGLFILRLPNSPTAQRLARMLAVPGLKQTTSYSPDGTRQFLEIKLFERFSYKDWRRTIFEMPGAEMALGLNESMLSRLPFSFRRVVEKAIEYYRHKERRKRKEVASRKP